MKNSVQLLLMVGLLSLGMFYFAIPALITGRLKMPRNWRPLYRSFSTNPIVDGPAARAFGLLFLVAGLILSISTLLGLETQSSLVLWGGFFTGTIIFIISWAVALSRARREHTSQDQVKKKHFFLKIPLLIMSIGLALLGVYLWNTGGDPNAFAVMGFLALFLFFFFVLFQLIEMFG